MKMNYEAPEAEVISFTAMEQLATTFEIKLDDDLDGNLGVSTGRW